MQSTLCRFAPPLFLTRSFEGCWSNRAFAIGASLLLASFVALVDYRTGDHFPLIFCYLPSILVICWVSHLAIGVCMAMACSTIWMIDDLLFVQEHLVTAAQYWTAVTHMGFYLVIIFMLMRIRTAHRKERRLARTDRLTGLMNAKAFHENAELEIERMRRFGSPLTIVYIDCDNFKLVNDRQGHFEGDRVLMAIGETMRKNVRVLDSAARLGGDEFAILLPRVSLEPAKLTVERLRDELNERMQCHDWPVTFSVGVSVFQTAPESVDELIHRSDVLMLGVKQLGKDAVAYELRS